MTTLEELTSKINEITKDNPVFYFTNDIERGLGLEKLIDNYHILCIDKNDINSYVEKEGTDVFCLSDVVNERFYRSSIKLLEHQETRKYLEKYPKGYNQTFKISPRFEKITSELGYKLINTSAELNRAFENKISQYKILSDAGVNFPKTRITEMKNVGYAELKDEFGEKLIIQFNRGHTGDSTILIENGEKFIHIKNTFPDRTVKIVEFIDSPLTYTLNGCITKSGCYAGGLCYQITGVERLAHSKSATVGNDYSVRKGINEEILEKIKTEFNKISEKMKSHGYRGMFGIDLIIRNEEVYIIEVNARQTQSVPFYTKLQLSKDEIPLSMLHLAEFLDIEVELDEKSYNNKNLEPITAAQLYLREKDDSKIKNYFKPGIYSQELSFHREDYSLNSRFSSSEILVYAKSKDFEAKKGDEFARIQVLKRLVSEDLEVEKWAVEYLLAIKNILK